MYSDKHQESGFNIHVAAPIRGDLPAAGDPIPAARHDAYALAARAPAETIAAHDTPGDKDHHGHATTHPTRKPPKAEITLHDQRFNASVTSTRTAAERANSHPQNRKIPTTRYRPPPQKLPATLHAIADHHHLKRAYE